MIRFPWDVLSVEKSTCEVCTFRRQHHKFRRAPWQTRTSEEDISTKEWAIFNLQSSKESSCQFVSVLLNGEGLSAIWASLNFIYKYKFVVILEIFWKKFQMFDSKKSVKIAPFISQLSWRVLKFWRRENFFQVKSYRSSYFRSRMGQYCWLQNFS